MFPLTRRKISGYKFGQKTFYNDSHTGTDYACAYDNYYAPFDGTITTGYGKEGGYFLTLTRDNGDQFTARHLSKFIRKSGRVKEGELIAITGNTGVYTTNPHLHQEVKVRGKLIDPEIYPWGERKTMKPQYIEQNGKIGFIFDFGSYSVIQWASDPAFGDQLSKHFMPEGDVLKIVKK